MRTLLSLMLVWMVWGFAAAHATARPDNVFLLGDKERPTRIVVTAGERLEKAPDFKSGMFAMTQGVIADLTGQPLAQLVTTPMPRTRLLDARGNLDRIGVAHLFYAKGEVKRVELFYGNEGAFLAQEMEAPEPGESPRVSKLDPERFRAAYMSWPRFRGELEPSESAAPAPSMTQGQELELERPYTQAPFYLDQETLGDRFLRGGKTRIEGVKRVLQEETMYVRLPRGYNPKRRAGLLVWISAAMNGHLPEVFTPALDELGIIGVGIRNVGNDREVADRFQLALDAVWTASRRYHVDPRRVYVTGLSGGGRVASRLVVCFADCFTGAVPIVGMDAYFNIPVGNGRRLPGMYKRPEGKIWTLSKKRRIGAITGENDPNGVGIREAARQMVIDGLQVRVFDYKRFAHQMPSASQFSEALSWVDEPYRTELAAEEQAARDALEKYRQKYGGGPPADEKQRDELAKVTEIGPWTDAAWEAVELLRRASEAR